MIHIKKSQTPYPPWSVAYAHLPKNLLKASSLQHTDDIVNGMDFFKELLDTAAKRHVSARLNLEGPHHDETGFTEGHGGIATGKSTTITYS